MLPRQERFYCNGGSEGLRRRIYLPCYYRLITMSFQVLFSFEGEEHKKTKETKQTNKKHVRPGSTYHVKSGGLPSTKI